MNRLSLASSLMILGGITGLFASAQSSPNGLIQVNLINDSTLAVSNGIGNQRVTLMNIECGEVATVKNKGKSKVKYEMVTGKRHHCSNSYSMADYILENGDTLTVKAFNDGIAWSGCHDYKINVKDASHDWLMTWTDSYEGFFPKDRNDIAKDTRIGYPSLFEFNNDMFMLLSESGLDRFNAASSMYAGDNRNIFHICPDGSENGAWQVAIIGHLADIVESTLINDAALPSRIDDTSWIKPGVASWIYWANNHGSNDYGIIKRYVDMARELRLPYVLIDAEWDEMKDGYTVLDAVNYAKSNGIKPMIWYNSSVGWIHGAPGPKFRLNTPEDREREFAWCKENGIAGVKIDFFSGDTNMNINYMVDLLECAARHKLLVNFHGATIPRGLQRTYPNLISVEAVYGAEWYNNVPTFTDMAASHNATLPFTRNVIGSMDYTPCAFTNSQHPHITTDGHELALTVLFESGIQHLADRPESFLSQPQEIKDFLSELPSAWDNTVLLGGYPADYVVIARQKGNDWYIAGINGNDTEKELEIDHSRLKINKKAKVKVISDNHDEKSWLIKDADSIPTKIKTNSHGGFVIHIKK